MADVIYSASLEDKEILAALKRIDSHIGKVAKQADKEFQSVGKSASASGVQIGAISGVVSSLTTAFIQLGQQAIGALVEIGQHSVQTAIEMDTLKARLGGIFDGSEEAADQAFTFIQKKSKELGFDLSELAGAFIPKTESLEQFERVAKIATALARSDPQQGAIGARIAIIEALSGTFSSLNRRFEISKEDTKRVQDAFNKEGIEGFITTLEAVLKESGKSFEDFADTAQTAFAKVGIAGEQIGGRIGVPIVASLEEAANKLLEFINANEDDLIVFADSVGRAIADVIDFIAGIDFSQFDTQTLIEIADYIFRIVNAAQIAGTQIATFAQQFSQLPGVSLVIQGLTYELEHLDDALLTLSQILALANASIAAFEASGVKAQVAMLLLSSTIKASHNDLVGAYEDFQKAEQVMASSASAQDAFKESILASNQQFEDYRASLEGNTTAQDNLRDSLNEAANAGTDTADAMQAAAVAERALAEAGEEAAEAQAKINEAKEKIELDFQRAIEDIDRKFEEDRLKNQIEFAQKREDQARKHLEKLSDIRRKNAEDIQDAETDLERAESAIFRKFSHERIDLEKEQRQSRLDIETSYREKLEDIQKQSNFDLEEAERSRDAVQYLKIIRQRQEQVTKAQTDRQREIEELRATGELKKQELAIQQQRELESARIANEEKLADLRLNLERQIFEQNLANEREFADIARAEQRKNEELERSRQFDIESAKIARERKLADLEKSLADELALIQKYNDLLQAEQAQHNAAMAAAEADSGDTTLRTSTGGRGGRRGEGRANSPDFRSGGSIGADSPNFRSSGGIGGSGSRTRNRRTGREFGGLVNAGGSYPVGENGPELFQPSSNGRIVPNSALVMPSMVPKSSINNVSNSRSQEFNIPMVSGGALLDPIFVAQIRNMILSEIGKVL